MKKILLLVIDYNIPVIMLHELINCLSMTGMTIYIYRPVVHSYVGNMAWESSHDVYNLVCCFSGIILTASPQEVRQP